MYKPAYTTQEDRSLAIQLIRENPLGLIISMTEGGFETSYLPFVWEESGDELFLISHLAKANPQTQFLNGPVLISFQGPNRYISPAWYKSQMEVPTWNYAVVQIQGRGEVTSDPSEIRRILQHSVTYFEERNGTNWCYNLPPSLQKNLESAIVGLKIHVENIDAKFKLSQNRRSPDFDSVLRALEIRSDSKDLEMRKWMDLTAKS